jgi:hypothetical protein
MEKKTKKPSKKIKKVQNANPFHELANTRKTIKPKVISKLQASTS